MDDGDYVSLHAMDIKYNLEEITSRYGMFYRQAIAKGSTQLPYYDVQPWDQVLNDVELRLFEDIRYYNIPLYPIFPVAENTFFHFANPFKKVAIEIVYKHSPLPLLQRKKMLFAARGWSVYNTRSNETLLTMEEFFLSKRKDLSIELETLTNEQQFLFAEKYKDQSSSCLLYYILEKHFRSFNLAQV